ncbi:nucleotidyl transferase AbiEii/AbiGii toxin family protein [Mucilaginibacter gilvus]|nr:nucleotidyl transferase AbiEii/AbiGii toxin family protein [Mucilaginibacter gilvus]
MKAEELSDFRLVGGTALSLQLGHRMSVDIDMFTDSDYGSVDFDAIEDYLKLNYPYVEGEFGGNPGLGRSYLVGGNPIEVVKLDLYYTMDPFFQPAKEEEGVRMATIEEIIAMKVDIVQRGGRKKDFWDLHELLGRFTINNMIALHQQRFEWTHDEPLIRKNFTQFSAADNDFDPICLKSKEWIFIKEDIEEAVAKSAEK